MKYRFVDHTADIAFEVFGLDLAGLLENATLAFSEAFTYPKKLGTDKKVKIEIKTDGPDYLLNKWLNELLYFFDTEFLGVKEVDVEVDIEERMYSATGVLTGGNITPELVKVEPKAITLHNFKVEKRKEGWYAFVVVDI